MSTWLRAALVRAIRTAAQAAIGVMGTGLVGILDVDWIAVLSVAGMGAVLSVLTSLAGLPEVQATVEYLDGTTDTGLIRDRGGLAAFNVGTRVRVIATGQAGTVVRTTSYFAKPGTLVCAVRYDALGDTIVGDVEHDSTELEVIDDDPLINPTSSPATMGH